MNAKNITKYTIALIVGSVLAGTISVIAIGGPTPPASVPTTDATMYSLTDIYNKLIDFTATAIENNASISTVDNPASLHHSLSDIYGLLESETNLTAANIKDGVSIFGVLGNYVTELEWSTEQGDLDWDDAVSACATLLEGGATAGDWRLPRIGELLNGLVGQYLESPTTHSGFLVSTRYWSGTEHGDNAAQYAGWSVFVYGDWNLRSATNYVRCVR